MLHKIYDYMNPTIHGAGGFTLLEVLPHTGPSLQSVAQTTIVLLTTIIQFWHLFKKQKKQP